MRPSLTQPPAAGHPTAM